MEFDDFRSRASAQMFEGWMEEVGLTEQILRGFHNHGIPEDWAKTIAKVFPDIPVSSWPRVIPSPKSLLHGKGNRSMLGSKMELENERVNKRVKISARMTSDSPAKKALLEAGITPRDVAALLGVGHSTVNAWCTGARSIPRAYVDRLREKHRIAAKVWPKIAD